MSLWKALTVAALCVVLPSAARAQTPDLKALADQIIRSDADFARSVAEKNKEKFLSFIAETTTFNGGMPNELKGRAAVMEGWEDFFAPDGPSLTWEPISSEVIGSGNVGYTIGRSVFKAPGPDGKVVERRGQYLTVWRKQADGSWKVVFDTGSSLP